MKTRDTIKQKALELFNAQGLMNVTLREVAAALKKSYGNITYHFKTKNELIRELYADMIQEMKQLTASASPVEFGSLIFELPNSTFDISMKYLFFYVDYVELKRHYPEFMKEVDRNNAERAKSLKGLMRALRTQGILDTDMDDDTLDYIMDLSGAVRTFYFQQHYARNISKKEYTVYVNRLLFPYLTKKGLKLYRRSLAGKF